MVDEMGRFDHEVINGVLGVVQADGQVYRKMGRSKLLRGINLKLQKNRVDFVGK